MKNSNLRNNTSILLRTDLSAIDDRSEIGNLTNRSFTNVNTNTNTNQNINTNQYDNHQLLKWLKCWQKVTKRFYHYDKNYQNLNTNCYMFEINDIIDIHYKRNYGKGSKENRQSSKSLQPEQESKLYLKLSANLYNAQISQYLSRTVSLPLIPLEHKSPSSPSWVHKILPTQISLFLHTKDYENIWIKMHLNISVVQSLPHGAEEVVLVQDFLGIAEIDVFRAGKSQQKVNIYSSKTESSTDGLLHYTVLVSDSFKVLQKLIEPNCLCSNSDWIGGLAGGKLPSSISSLYHKIEYTQLQSLKLDITGIQISDNMIANKIKQSQDMIKHLYNTQGSTKCNFKQIFIETCYHNGWTSFSSAILKMESKMDIQRKTVKHKTQKVVELLKYKNYEVNDVCKLPFVFVDQESLTIMQIKIRLEIKAEKTTHTLTLPLCFTLFPLPKLCNDEKQMLQFYPGDCLSNPYTLLNTKSNYIGKIEFYLSIENANKMQISKHLPTIANKSQNDFDRITLQKQRMIKQNRKLRQQNRIKKIQLNSQIPILDTTEYKNKLYKNEIQKLRQQKKQKQEILEYLKNKIKQLQPSETQSKQTLSEYQQNFYNQINKNNLQNGHNKNLYNSMFYKTAIAKNQSNIPSTQSTQDIIHVHTLPLISNINTATLFKSNEVPEDIIKTELLQKNYTYAIFINWISLIPIIGYLPRKFLFQISFFKKNNLVSNPCVVNQSTGEIQIAKQNNNNNNINNNNNNINNNNINNNNIKQKQKVQRIFYTEVIPQQNARNSETVFIQFIGYLYHSDMQIKIIDYYSHIEYGQCYFKLKDIIRIRRNQVSIIRDLWVKKQKQVKAKLKMEVKTIRKQTTYAQQQATIPTSDISQITMQPQARQLMRIQKLKKIRQNSEISPTLSKIENTLAQQFMKEEINLYVSRMHWEVFKINIPNRKNHNIGLKLIINDPDQQFLATDELVVVNRVLYNTLIGTKWWSYIQNLIATASSPSITFPDNDNTFEIGTGQTSTILLYYCSERKYEGDFQRGQLKQSTAPSSTPGILKMYNRNRFIDLTLTNSSNSQIVGLYKVHIIPQPDYSNYTYRLYRKANTKLYIQIPYLMELDYVVYIDDPTVVSKLNQNNKTVGLDCWSATQKQMKTFNVSILSSFPQNRMLINYKFEIYSVKEIEINCDLWSVEDLLVDFHNSVCANKQLSHVLALASDQKAMELRDKNPIKMNQKQSKTIIRLQITSSKLGISYHELNIINPQNYEILYRYNIKIITKQPQIIQKLILRIKMHDKIIEEFFNVKNQTTKKRKYQVLSTHPHILTYSQDIVQIDAKTQKKLKIRINAQEMNESEAVILTLKQDKIRYHYLFILELDSIF